MDERCLNSLCLSQIWMKSARDQFGVAKLDLSAEFAVFGQISPFFNPDNPPDEPLMGYLIPKDG